MSDQFPADTQCMIGATQAPSYTPPAAHPTWWRLTHTSGEVKEALGQTAFYACQAAKWGLAELTKIEQTAEPSKGPAERISALYAARKADLDNWDAAAKESPEMRDGHRGRLYRTRLTKNVRCLREAMEAAKDPLNLSRLPDVASLRKAKEEAQIDHEYAQARLQGEIDAAEAIGG